MNFFPETTKITPKIYGYTELSKKYKGLIKVGFTTKEVKERMKQHYPTNGPSNLKKYKVLLEESSMRNDGTSFKDHLVHKILENNNIERVGGEWFRCSVNDVKAAINAAKERSSYFPERVSNFSLRPEQEEAVEKTKNYFKSFKSAENKIPHFLWNCKMRFGKTFASYKLSQKMNWKKVLILTFKPAVENSWKEDLLTHVDFKEWEFLSKDSSTKEYDEIDKDKPFVCFASFQDFLGKNKAGGIKLKNQWAHHVNWDCIILDEYHYGSWRDNAKGILSDDDKLIKDENQEIDKESGFNSAQDIWSEDISPLNTNHYLYLSGTPFRAIESGEFIEEQIYNWTYSDEQLAKQEWKGDNNPYLSLPRMVMMTYQMPESITQITDKGEFNEFDLNEFFRAEGTETNSKFIYENYVQQWLNLIRGSGINNIYDNLKLGKNKPVLPFADSRLINILTHTFWFLPSVASCYAMRNLMLKSSNKFYHDYEIIVSAGQKAGVGIKALTSFRKKMSDPIKSKTITLSCGKLTTGVTVKPWSGIFMLRNTTSPETYFQAAFRVQSPWTIEEEDNPNSQKTLKEECYLFDFAPNRALRLITDYSCRLNLHENDPESKVENFIKFLPVLCFDGTSLRQINAEQVLDYGMVGTSGTQLAKKFESARLVHVDDNTLKKLMENKQAMDSLMKIEGFRNLNSDLEKIINHSENINEAKKDASQKEISSEKKRALNDEEKKQKTLRKQIQEKLQKFVTRVPVFMYLTDYREATLKDVITKLEPELFKKVTSLSVKDFELLLSLGLFNSSLMNAAVFAFRRYEESSLQYTGVRKNEPKKIGLFDTNLSSEEFINQQVI